jgi:hypothetical protein
LNERGWYLSIGGEARYRYEYFSQFNFGLGPQDDNGYLLQRYLLHADAHFGKRIRVFTQLQSAIGSGRDGGPRLTDDDRLEAHQAFLDLKFGDEAKSLTFRVGRHEMDFGSGRLISASEGLNVRRSFDGLRLIYRHGPWLINGQVNKLVSIKPGLFNACHYPHFCAKWICTFSACGAGGRIEPGVERSGTPGTTMIYRTSPRSGRQRLAQSQ